MSEVIPITFEDPGQRTSILNLLGSVYNDPRDALKEYVANSLDADASNIVVDLSQRRTGTVQIKDDGTGMDKDKLRSVPDRVGLSDKLLLENRIGEKAIGILAFHSLGVDSLILWSRTDARPADPHCLQFKRGDPNPVLDPDDEVRIHPWLTDMRGTVVELRGIPSDVGRVLTLEKVKDHLGRLYREILRRRAVRIVVVEGKKSEHVTMESFKGEPFWMRDLLTKYGRIELQLYILPSPSDRRIEVFCKGQKVCELVVLDDRFRAVLWSGGQVHGDISADFLKPTTGRTGFVTNSGFTAFVEKLDGIKTELEKAVDLEVETYRTEQDREIQRDLNNSFLRAILQLRTQGWSAVETLVKSRRGEIKGTAIDTDSGVKTQRQGLRRRRKGIRHLVVEDKTGEQPAVRGAGINFEQKVFDSQEAHLRSKFDSRQSLILINQGHPNYKEEYPERHRRYDYFHLLLAKELTLYNWGRERADALLEHLVELDITAKHYRSGKEFQ